MPQPLVRPFAGLRPTPESAAAIAAPPYDVLDTEEARVLAADKPWSFLHISKPEIDLPAGISPYASEVYAKGAQNLRRMVEAGVLKRDPVPCYYVYRLTMGDHVQTGLVVAGSVAAYNANRIRRHEFTRPDKEDDRVRQIEAVDAQTGPVLIAHPDHPDLSAVVTAATEAPPAYAFTAYDGIGHALWVIADPAVQRVITSAFEAMPAIYIADGHHRSAAAARVAAARNVDGADLNGTGPSGAGEMPHASFLMVSFPISQMKILDYNRVVRDLNGLSPEEFLAALNQNFTLEATPSLARPRQPREFGLYLKGQWYRLGLKQPLPPENEPVARLDVSLLSDRLLTPVLGISDLRKDKRIDFVGGKRGLEELARRVDSGEMAVAFALFPTRMEDLVAVADAGEVMPPKSTWFEPKLADGLVSKPLH
ncbi:DUF1015 domain-containing protein [uncultured Gammaproteobacteria bacterium]